MLGMTLKHKHSGITGTVDAVNVMADGTAIARIADHWFEAAELGPRPKMNLSGAYAYFCDDNDLPRFDATPEDSLRNLDAMAEAVAERRRKLLLLNSPNT